MKYWRSFLLVLSCFCSFSVEAQVLDADAFEKQYLAGLADFSGLRLDSVWQYFPGTGISLSNIEAQKDWHQVTSIRLQDLVGNTVAWSGSGWFRKSFTVPDSLNGTAIAFMIAQFGASEIYVDNKLIGRFGEMNTSTGAVKGNMARQVFSALLNHNPVQ